MNLAPGVNSTLPLKLRREFALMLEPGACVARLAMSKTLLAARLGIKKETLSRLLRELADEGIVGVSGREIAVRDREALRRIAESMMPPESVS